MCFYEEFSPSIADVSNMIFLGSEDFLSVQD